MCRHARTANHDEGRVASSRKLTLNRLDPAPDRRYHRRPGVIMRHRTTVPILFAFAVAMACILYSGCAGSRNAKGGADVVSAPSALPGGKPSLQGAIPPYSGPGKSLVVYFTQGSATRWVAEDLAELFQADLEPLLERTPRKTTFTRLRAHPRMVMGTLAPRPDLAESQPGKTAESGVRQHIGRYEAGPDRTRHDESLGYGARRLHGLRREGFPAGE